MTPPKLIPPDHSTAATGTLPTEQTNVSTAMIGPTITFSSSRGTAGALSRNSELKKSLPSSPMKPAMTNPSTTSFHTIAQSLRKLWATSDHASTERTRRRSGRRDCAEACWCPLSACWAWRRALSSRRRETNRRSSSVITTISSRPPISSARVNCQPISSQITIPSSITRFVEANWKASALAAEAPFWKSDLAIATAA